MNHSNIHIQLLFIALGLLPVMTPLYGQEVEFEPGDSIILKRYVHLAAGTGIMNYQGELLNDINLPPSRRLGTHFLINYGFSPSFTLGIGLNTGRLYGQLRSDSTSILFTNLNFMSPIFSQQLRLTYNFGGVYKGVVPGVVQPWIFAGIESLFFNPYGDNTTATSTPYYYWKDGSIRDMPELPENIFQANYIQRDYIYETILQSADFDGTGSYPLFTFSVPVGMGVDFNLNQNFSLSFGVSYHFTLTDHLDDITHKSGSLDPSRAIGDRRNDRYITFQAGLTYKWYDLRKVGVRMVIPPPTYVQLPIDFIPFDLNRNGLIDRAEVITAIDELFNGVKDFDPELIGLLVDFYNVQSTTQEKINY